MVYIIQAWHSQRPKKPMDYAFSFLKGKQVKEVAIWVQDFYEAVLKDYVRRDRAARLQTNGD